MTQANDSITVTPGTGATVATHLVNGKEHEVVMVAHSSGHIHGTIPTYSWWRTFTVGAASQRTLDIFNASGSGKIVKLRKLFLYHDGSVQTGVPHIFSLIRTSTVGTGGTVLTGAKQDSNDAAIPAQITARMNATGGATEGVTVFGIVVDTEETRPATGIAPMINWMPEGDDVGDLVLREGEGALVKQITSSTVGIWGCLIVASIVDA
jgi:hypothetical protein